MSAVQAPTTQGHAQYRKKSLSCRMWSHFSPSFHHHLLVIVLWKFPFSAEVCSARDINHVFIVFNFISRQEKKYLCFHNFIIRRWHDPSLCWSFFLNKGRTVSSGNRYKNSLLRPLQTTPSTQHYSCNNSFVPIHNDAVGFQRRAQS